ncbi:heparinase II/III family protein [Clostridium guangxiense]|uniref:heparinase II/III family protein n=1 Tax=Clostridium guangxiense TaxID=1662055 RepID=UPI001E34C311|nr:heparinase II/III family protein [Clostridium guangxiense]MCD2346393.1 heparinase II/III family protein [Clostridium guangxiense]
MKKEDFFNRDNSCYFFDDGDAIAEYCMENCKEDIKHIIRVADEVCKHYFVFDLKWDMERTYDPVTFEGTIDWSYIPYGDPEFVYQFNRHRFFICLGQAYLLTGDEKYAKAYVELTEDWIDNVPLTDEYKAGPWRTLEVGLRGETWNKALRYFKDSPYVTEEFLDKFYNCMIQHAEYLIESHSNYCYISNWGVLQNHGLFEIAICLPPHKRTNEYIKIALKNLEIEARMQIMNDGVQWEQSPMYHNEVFHCYLDVLILASRNNVTIPDSIYERVKKMALANVAWMKPNHNQFMMGDSDDTDIRDLVSTAAYIYNDPVLKFGGYEKFDFESIWDLGIKAEKEYENIQSKEPEVTSIMLGDSGNTYLRSDWSERANLLHFHAGTLGAGHGHSDQLHIDLVVNGEDVLMDSGRYTYVYGPKRFEYKNPDAHNTITVDNKYFTVCKDSWLCSKLSQPVKQGYSKTQNCEFVQAGHLGYMDIPGGVYVNRKIINIGKDIYIIVDEMYTSEKHEYEQFFHFSNYGKVKYTKDENNKINYTGKNACVDFYFMSADIKVNLQEGHISRNYNQEENNMICKIVRQNIGFTSLITVINADAKQKFTVDKIGVKSALKGSYYDDTMAEGLKIICNEKTYVIIICHQEVNSPTDLVEADGCMGYGNVIVFDKDRDYLVGEVLNW